MRALAAEEEGSTSVLTAGIIVVIGAVLLVVLTFAQMAVASHKAQNAANGAALGGAHALVMGQPPCLGARHLAEANGGRLVDCATYDRDVVVRVAVGQAEATARAGPID